MADFIQPSYFFMRHGFVRANNNLITFFITFVNIEILHFFKMNKQKLFLYIILIFWTNITIAAKSDFETLKDSLDINSLPLINITVDKNNVNKNSYVNGTIEIVDYQRRNPDSQFTVTYSCQIKYRGATSLGYDKKSFAIKLIDDEGDKLESNILGLRVDNSWILDAMAIDRIRMRNRVCFDLWNQLSKTPYETKFDNRNGTVGMFVEVFLNGKYHGLYCLTDKINRQLLGLKKADTDKNGNVTVKGLLYKGKSWDEGIYSSYLRSYEEERTDTVRWNTWELEYPDDYPSDQAWQPLMDLIDFCSSKTTNDVFQNKWQTWFYMNNLVEYYIMTLALNVGDNLYKNTYLSIVNISKNHLYMITPWDMDASLGGNWDGKHNENFSNINRYYNRAPFGRLVSSNLDSFMDKAKSLWADVSSSVFSMENVYGVLENYADMLDKSGAWQREYKKWNKNPVELTESVYEELDYVKRWYKDNRESLFTQFGIEDRVTLPFMVFPDKAIYDIRGNRIHEELYALPRGFYFINGQKIFLTQ